MTPKYTVDYGVNIGRHYLKINIMVMPLSKSDLAYHVLALL